MSKSEGFFRDRFLKKKRKQDEYGRQLPTEEEPTLPPPVEPIKGQREPARNDPCPCGSGKKYKHCCAKKR